MLKKLNLRFPFLISSLLASILVLAAIVGCKPKVTISDFSTVSPGGRVEVNKGIGVAVKIDPPDASHITYNWIATRGKVKVASPSAPAGTYEAPATPGMETITVEVLSRDKVQDRDSIQIDVVAAEPPEVVVHAPRPESETPPTPPAFTVPLNRAPATWGRPIPGSLGSITYFSRATMALKGTVNLSGLTPQHTYALTLNGWLNRPGNDALAQYNRNREGEGYMDFDTVQTDERGNAQVGLNVSLPPSEYDVKFFVKDPASNWCVVLYNDHLRFVVEQSR